MVVLLEKVCRPVFCSCISRIVVAGMQHMLDDNNNGAGDEDSGSVGVNKLEEV